MKLPLSNSVLWTLLAATPLLAAPRESVELRWRAQPGDSLRYRITSDQNFESSMMPQGVETKTGYVLRLDVKEALPDGVTSAEVHYEAIRLQSGFPIAMSYDSTLKGDAAKANSAELASVFEPMLAATLHVQVEPSGRIREIRGLEEMLDQAVGEKGSRAGKAVPPMLKSMLNPDSLRRMMEPNIFPEKSLGIGDTWKRSFNMTSPTVGGMTFELENKLTGVEKREKEGDCAKIAVTGTITTKKGEPEVAGPMKMSIATSKITGEMLVAVSSGQLVQSSSETTMEVTMSMGGGPEKSDEMNMDSTITVEQRMLRLAKDDPYFE